MNVSKINSTNKQPNFQSLKTIKCKGLYENAYPEAGEQLKKVFIKNPLIKELCNKYDVYAVFSAYNRELGSVKSDMHLYYTKPDLPLLQKICKYLTKENRCICINSFANRLNEPNSIETSTQELAQRISPYTKTNPLGKYFDNSLNHILGKTNKS